MVHSINAVVGPADTVRKIVVVAGGPPPTALPFGLVIAPLAEAQIEKLTGTNLGEIAKGFSYFSPSLERALADAAGECVFAYIETEYSGGIGTQAAALFSGQEAAVRLIEPDIYARATPNSPINSALRALGVRSASARDEFDTVGLGRFRDFADFGGDVA